MKIPLIISVFVILGFGQINWEGEIVDTTIGYSYNFVFNSLALDTNGIPHIVYNKCSPTFRSIVYASRGAAGWQKETVDSGLSLIYGLSLTFDSDNISHLSYYKKYHSFDAETTYMCYALRETTGWQINNIDTIIGYFGDWYWYIRSSIDLDTAGLPGIAYTAWNTEDSLHYLKYAHYNGSSWDTSIVTYDSTWNGPAPSDHSQSLQFDSNNRPHIAFGRCHGIWDTLKYAHYSDTTGAWLIEPIYANDKCAGKVSLALDSHNYPCIAFDDVALAYTWWDGSSWHLEYVDFLGDMYTKVDLCLDDFDNPHIIYLQDPFPYRLDARPKYCYKDSIWYLCGPVEPDTSYRTVNADISLAIDDYQQAHACYQFSKYDSVQEITGIKYAKGISTGTMEKLKGNESKQAPRLQVYPNPCRKVLHIKLHTPVENPHIVLFNVSGEKIAARIVKKGLGERSIVTNDLPCGIYFVQLKTPSSQEIRKVVLLK